MTSFRIAEDDLAAAQLWAERLGVDRSELLREAVRSHLAQLQAQADAETWGNSTLTDAELSFTDVAEWGPAEDWSDWLDATR